MHNTSDLHSPATSAISHGHAIYTMLPQPQATTTQWARKSCTHQAGSPRSGVLPPSCSGGLTPVQITCSTNCPGLLSCRRILNMHICCTLVLPHSTDLYLDFVRARSKTSCQCVVAQSPFAYRFARRPKSGSQEGIRWGATTAPIKQTACMPQCTHSCITASAHDKEDARHTQAGHPQDLEAVIAA